MLPRPPDPRSLSCLFCEISTAPVGGGGGAPGFYEKGMGLFRRAEGQSAPAQAEDGTVSELGGRDTCHLQTAFRRTQQGGNALLHRPRGKGKKNPPDSRGMWRMSVCLCCFSAEKLPTVPTSPPRSPASSHGHHTPPMGPGPPLPCSPPV